MADLHLQIGTSQLNSGNYPQALQELLTAEDLDGDNPVIQNNLGLAYFVRNRYDLSEKHIRKALDQKSDYTDARNNLARLLIEKGQLDEAIKEAKSAAEDLTYTSPEKPMINLGLAYFKQGKFAEAKTHFLKAIDYQRDNCLANSYYGRSLYELKDKARAAAALDRAVGFCQRTQFDEPHYYSALTYYAMGQKDKAVARFEELIKLYPNGAYVDKSKIMLETIRK
ncbi:MAG: hypothetical protein COT73_07710 [Bdellovibrio sp. CG10_big_fil_rev_8_21_14_0_10_47_8]|nr:MAG: hypothetical protein COT73_07710 [Bdellovibrio sp. CG10_big_fil_rev_8_21_14_0_10_47_8]